MDIATLVGLLGAFGMMLWAIASGSGLGPFIDVPSLILVIGGTFMIGFVHFPLKDMLTAGKVAKNTMFTKPIDNQKLIEQLVDYANRARREGILALEGVIQETSNRFLAQGIQLAVDGQEAEAIEAILSAEIDQMKKRHTKGQDIFFALGSYSPAMGLIGTLIGLVQMLQNLSDPSKIGPAMAIALLTTFYGAILANVIFLPFKGKLEQRSNMEIFSMELILEGILAISAGDNPRVVEQRLNAYFAPAARVSVNK